MSCLLDVNLQDWAQSLQSTLGTKCKELANAEDEDCISPEQVLRAFAESCCSGSQSKQEQGAMASEEAEAVSLCVNHRRPPQWRLTAVGAGMLLSETASCA